MERAVFVTACLLLCWQAVSARQLPLENPTDNEPGFRADRKLAEATGSADSDVKLQEKAVLLKLKQALGSHPAFEAGGWVDVAPGKTAAATLPCTATASWKYISCDTTVTPPRVQAIDLGGNLNLNGSLPSSVAMLTALQTLDLSGNAVAGPIPAGLSNMASLQVLNLAGNRIYGAIPDEVGSMLQLTDLELGTNNINGTIPASFSKLVNLKTLSMPSTLLGGPLPDLSQLSKLQTLDLNTNQFTGLVPPFLAELPKLSVVDFGTNSFYGPLPQAIQDKASQYKSLRLFNNYINGTIPESFLDSAVVVTWCCVADSRGQRPASQCTSFYNGLYPSLAPPAAVGGSTGGKKSSSSVPVIAIIVPLVLIALVTIILMFVMWRRRKAQQQNMDLLKKTMKQHLTAFGLSDLKRATKKFNQIIGKGGYGTVYKATLKDGTTVAVKRLDKQSKQGDIEFIREVELLSRLHHRHLVNLVGFCAEEGERILVYEYMSMGSLYEHLHGPMAEKFPLTWDTRLKIAIHVALGLEYLHYGADPPLIHRDVKSANILLNEEFSKVADFGLCKEAPLGVDDADTVAPTATAVRGSFGYLDPEYVNTSILSEKSDVYSYGVVLLELISGHKSIHKMQPLAYWAEEFLDDSDKMPDMVDPGMEGVFDIDELIALCEIARACIKDQAISRPTMREVSKQLVERLGQTLGGSSSDNSSFGSSGDLSDVISNYSGGDANSHSQSLTFSQANFSYQNYSETLHWDTNKGGAGSDGASAEEGAAGAADKKRRFPVPMPQLKRPTSSESQPNTELLRPGLYPSEAGDRAGTEIAPQLPVSNLGGTMDPSLQKQQEDAADKKDDLER
eukprot:jgi/Mesen1/4428/ME000225S03417